MQCQACLSTAESRRKWTKSITRIVRIRGTPHIGMLLFHALRAPSNRIVMLSKTICPPSTQFVGFAPLSGLRYGSFRVFSDAIDLRYGAYRPCFRPARASIWVISTFLQPRLAFYGPPSSYFPTRLANFGGQKFPLLPFLRVLKSK